MPEKESGSLGLSLGFLRSRKAFDSAGRLRESSDPSSGMGGAQAYTDVTATLEGLYGLTDSIALWMDFPLVWRGEHDLYNTSSFGIGDIRIGSRLRPLAPSDFFEVALDISARFPTGDTHAGFRDPATGLEPSLPLGRGNTDVSAGLAARQRFLGGRLALDESLKYTFHIASRVEYLFAPLVTVPAPDGSREAVTASGNLVVDWGDELTLGARAAFVAIPRLTLAAAGSYRYRHPTKVEDFEFVEAGGSTDIRRIDRFSNASHLFSLTPSVLFSATPRFTLRAAAQIPLYGDSYPAIPLAESLVGIRFTLEIRYGF